MARINFAFFGTSHVAVYVLDELERAKLLPSLIVTMPDAPKGRGQQMSLPAVKEWALARNIEVLQPEDLKHSDTLERLAMFDVAVVCDYGKILPKVLLEAPKKGFLNVHPSLLPRLRGASPMRSAILTDEKRTGVTIMLVDEKMDHGPIISQKIVPVEPWPSHIKDMERVLMSEGGRILSQVLPLWVRGEIEAHEQHHDVATFCEMFKKEDGLLDLNDDPHKNLLKIRAFEGWPGTFAFFERGGKRMRAKIIDAHIAGGKLIIDRVVPEGKKEMSYDEFLRSGARLISS